MAAVKKRKVSKLFCSHCSRRVSKSTWYRHYSDFYNPGSGRWERELEQESDFRFNSSDESDSGMPAQNDGVFSGYLETVCRSCMI